MFRVTPLEIFYFNTKTVQLKEKRFYATSLISIFQYQNGTIKSIGTIQNGLVQNHFNTKTVQLKGIKGLWILRQGGNFNTKTVQLKESWRKPTRCNSLYFNTKTVQLKEGWNKRRFEYQNSFQYQNGTIKRPSNP